jgi:hypothetical protein
MLRRAVLTALVALAVTAAPAAALAVDVNATLGKAGARVVERSSVPVLLPDLLDLDHDQRVYGTGGVTDTGYALALTASRRCAANACYLASFDAERGGTPAFRRRVKLRGGVPGWFKPVTCGASCSPATIQFRTYGVLYSISASLPDPTSAAQLRRLRTAANEALKAGPRH